MNGKNEKKKEEEAGLIKARSIFLSGHINESSSRKVIEDLIRLEKESPLEDISLYVDSYGGYLDSVFAIIDTMNLIHCDVETICIGKAISGAALVLSAGKKGKRLITPNGRTMIHQLFAFSWGTAQEIDVEVKEIKRLQELMERTMAKNTGKSIKQVRQDMRETKYMDAAESLTYGLVDKIRERR